MAAEIAYCSSYPYTFLYPQSHKYVNIREAKVPRKRPRYFSLDAAVCCGDVFGYQSKILGGPY